MLLGISCDRKNWWLLLQMICPQDKYKVLWGTSADFSHLSFLLLYVYNMHTATKPIFFILSQCPMNFFVSPPPLAVRRYPGVCILKGWSKIGRLPLLSWWHVVYYTVCNSKLSSGGDASMAYVVACSMIVKKDAPRTQKTADPAPAT